jgi:hypothetical protein
MADARDLHQIEYRHHQTKDLSPVASSMSTESLRAWDSRVRMWVRHPHADQLSESVCYQVLAAGQAALALRYWDQRAAERTDGSRGRPLVSRVLVGSAGVLTPEVAVALCRTGLTAGSVGPMPGEVPEGAGLPTVSGDALSAVANAMIPTLDEEAARQRGLQAVVAAALADPLAPLAISLPDAVIQQPLREGAQYPLLWGLRRITGPLHGPVGRVWSFSTFEPPLGETDPASLPSIVFRQTPAGAQTPPARWRKEVNVRPLAPDALGPGPAYAAWVEMAGWLVTEYQERGGEGLAQFVANCCGNERSLPMRVERIFLELRRAESRTGPRGTYPCPPIGRAGTRKPSPRRRAQPNPSSRTWPSLGFPIRKSPRFQTQQSLGSRTRRNLNQTRPETKMAQPNGSNREQLGRRHARQCPRARDCWQAAPRIRFMRNTKRLDQSGSSLPPRRMNGRSRSRRHERARPRPRCRCRSGAGCRPGRRTRHGKAGGSSRLA